MNHSLSSPLPLDALLSLPSPLPFLGRSGAGDGAASADGDATDALGRAMTYKDALSIRAKGEEAIADGTADDGTAGGGSGGSSGELSGDGRRVAMKSPALIVFAYNRPKYLEQTLKSLSTVEGLQHVTVYVSQVGPTPPPCPYFELLRYSDLNFMFLCRGRRPRGWLLGTF